MISSDLDTELRRAADKTAESIMKAARAEAEEIAAEAKRSIEEQRRELMADKEAEYGADVRRAIAAERHAAMRDVLLARTALVGRVLERARALLPQAVESQDYLSGLDSELAETLKFVEGDEVVVRCSPTLESAVRKALTERPQVEVEAETGTGSGFIVLGGGGTVLVDGWLDTRIDRLASSFAIEIHARLKEL